jgi:hypothetical protein
MWRKKRQQQKLLNELRWCNLTRKWMPDGFSSSFLGVSSSSIKAKPIASTLHNKTKANGRASFVSLTCRNIPKPDKTITLLQLQTVAQLYF